MITQLEEAAPTNRAWNGRDDIRQHYVGHFPDSERVLTLTLSWKREQHTPLCPVGKFRFDMPTLVKTGFARKHGDEYVIRFQRTGRLIEVAINRSRPAKLVAPLPARYFAL
jgi:hypothetical protein